MSKPKLKKVIISVVSDLVTDQRVHRQALTLFQNGYSVTLVGRQMRTSLSIEPRPYKTKRFRLLFEKGFLFYASFNIRLFFYLIFRRSDILIANDLDTLLPNFMLSILKRSKLVYDSHEYFTEVPELVDRPFVRTFWLRIEKLIFPMLKNVITVNDSIASIYLAKYNVPVNVIRNLPFRSDPPENIVARSEWNLPLDKKIFLFQGAGINVDRGAEESIDAIRRVDRAVLLFIGGGDVIDKLKSEVQKKNLNEKVFFIPKQPLKDLIRFTAMADFGLTLDKNTNLNYKFSLPNKIFDYIQASIPILATDLFEVKRIVEKYNIGLIAKSPQPELLAGKMKEMMDENKIDTWKKNINIAADELCWERERHLFLRVFQ